MKTTPLHWAVGALALLCSSGVLGQSALRDPTQPSKGALSTPPPDLPPASRADPGARAATKQLPSDLRLHVLVLHKEQALAVVDGGVVKLGDAVQDWRVVELSERGLALRQKGEVRQVSLTPAVVKTAQPHTLEAPP